MCSRNPPLVNRWDVRSTWPPAAGRQQHIGLMVTRSGTHMYICSHLGLAEAMIVTPSHTTYCVSTSPSALTASSSRAVASYWLPIAVGSVHGLLTPPPTTSFAARHQIRQKESIEWNETQVTSCPPPGGFPACRCLDGLGGRHRESRGRITPCCHVSTWSIFMLLWG